MSRFWVLFLCAPAFAANIVPNRYIVELSNESVAARVLRTAPSRHGRLSMRGTDAEQHRLRIRAEQSVARDAIVRAGGTVTGAVENVHNALLVQIDDSRAAGLTAISGVAKVHPVRSFHLLLDHALPLHHVPEAWTQAGIANAGAGMRIGMIDTGIEIGHPGFNDGGFTAPAGFPVADNTADLAFTNNKVIVARSYASLFAATDPDLSVRDHVGHGTATAMAAAGVMNAGPLATISGVAPQAYIGMYKVFGTPGVNDSAPEDAVLQAIDDAVGDGMDVINLSLGTDIAVALSQDLEVQALERAAAAGVIVIASAGNNGPNPATAGSPAVAPSVIAVGASNNDRVFAGSVVTPAGDSLLAVPGSGVNSKTPIAAPLMDISTLDSSGQACSALPANSLTGAVALIFRGICTFQIKLNNAQAAGAVGAVVYDNVPVESPFTMAVGDAALPAEFVSNRDGLRLKDQLSKPLAITLQFDLKPHYVDPASLASFSSLGPGVDYSIKPDMVAVGENMYTAAQTFDAAGSIYNASGYSIEQGTSFSAPLVAGAAALIKAARPGLTSAEYRSLLVNSAAPASLAPGATARVQQGGTGILDVFAALNATAAAAPVSLGFGVGGSDLNAVRNLTITNLGTAAGTFQLSVAARDSNAPVPQLPMSSVQLDAGASISIPVQFQASGLAAGQYEGYIDIQRGNAGVTTRVPYWYGVSTGQAAYITVLYHAGSGAAGSLLRQAVVFRLTDAAGLPVAEVPVVAVVSGGGRVTGLIPVGSEIPNAYSFNARLGNRAGSNVFQIQAGSLTATVTITGQ